MILDGIEVEVTHPERVLFPRDGITKADLASYYAGVSETMLPHLRTRPLNLQRFPRGIDAAGFVQQEAPPNLPDWVGRITVAKEGGESVHIVADNGATLVWLANLSCITPHIWLSCGEAPDLPDRMIFDLDPPEDDFETVRHAARLLREMLQERKLPSYLMTTGSRGLHVIIPLKATADFDTVRAYSQKIAADLVKQDPKRFTTEMQKENRSDRLFVDTLRNAYGHTAVAPYAVRARDGAPVALPVRWEALDDPAFSSRCFTLGGRDEWLKDARDAWGSFKESSILLDGLSQRSNQS